MAMTQGQPIRSPGEAMAWFERERQWGIEATAPRRSCGRIGEWYAAPITTGRLAPHVDPRGHDAVSARGCRCPWCRSGVFRQQPGFGAIS